MQLNTAISKLTIYAIKHPEQEEECLNLIDLLSENFIITTKNNEPFIISNTVDDAVKNLFYKASLVYFDAPSLNNNIQQELKKSISPTILNQLGELISLIQNSTKNMEKFYKVFELGIEEKLEIDFSDYKKASFPFAKKIAYYNNYLCQEYKTFPFMRVAQFYLKNTLALKNLTDIEEIKSFKAPLSKDLTIYDNFKKINKEVKFFDENNLSPLEKTTQYAKNIIKQKNNYIYENEYNTWGSMLFNN